MKNIYSILAQMTLFLFLGACQSADEKRACEILDELNVCWSSVSDATANENSLQTVTSCQNYLLIEFSALDVNTSSDDKRKMTLTQSTYEQCLESSTTINDIKRCLRTFIQVTKDILSCR